MTESKKEAIHFWEITKTKNNRNKKFVYFTIWHDDWEFNNIISDREKSNVGA